MIARINTSKNISKALNYNEQKVQLGKAQLLHAANFLKDADELTFHDKLWHYERLNSLNEAVSTNTLHVSLNFDPSEQIPNDKLVEIADAYMKDIGFDNQPYLVYRHQDAGHPHIHIVSNNIQWGGKRISMHNLGRNQSERSRKEIEMQFGLVKADSKTGAGDAVITPVDAQKIQYGKSETRQAISNVLRSVISQYKFTSLEQLNAILGLYNVVADRGEPDSRTFQHNGLLYQILDEKGKRIGKPIKASSFFMKPTLKMLEQKFAENQPLLPPLKKRVKTVLDWTLQKPPVNLQALIRAVEKENVSIVLRQNKQGNVYGITYIDHKAKAVFNGSDIGKEYSAKAILECCPNKSEQQTAAEQKIKAANSVMKQSDQAGPFLPSKVPQGSLLDILIAPVEFNDFVPYQLKGKKKKKKKRMNF